MISLIIPCWNDRPRAIALARKWADHALVREVIIAGVQSEAEHFGQSGPPTGRILPVASSDHPKIKECSVEVPGRGPQMNLAATSAAGNVLLFHHVDSFLTEAHLESLTRILADENCVG